MDYGFVYRMLYSDEIKRGSPKWLARSIVNRLFRPFQDLARRERRSAKMPLNIYVAAKFEEKEKVRKAYDLLRHHGHRITHDWTNEDATRFPDGSEEQLQYLEDMAHADIEGVANADAVVLFPHEKGKGLFVELGVALAKDIPVLVVSERDLHRGDCIFFFADACVVVRSVEDAITVLRDVEHHLLSLLENQKVG